ITFKKTFFHKSEFKFLLTLVVIFLVYLLFGSINGSYSAIINLIFYFLIIILYLINLILFIDYKQLEEVMQVIIISIIFMSLLAINQWLFDNGVVSADYFYRAGGVFRNPNLLAQNILLLLPAAFMCLNKYRFISLLTLVIASITVLITQSRGNLILLFLVTLMYIVLDNRELIINKIKYIFWLILIVIVTLFLLDDSYFNRFSI